MPDNKNYGFSFDFEDDNSNDIFSSSSGPKTDEFEDIISDTGRNLGQVSFSSFTDISSSRYRKKKRGLAAACQRVDEWWHKHSTVQRAFMVVGIVLFTLLALVVIWAFIPFFEMRGKLFASAFGLMVLNMLVYFCIIWDKRKLQTVLMSITSVLLSVVMIVTLFFWLPFLNLIYNFDHTFPSNAEDLAAVPAIDKNITNVALFGIDTRDSESFKGNSDSIMILSINAKEHTVKIISIMRDSLVPIERNGTTVYTKINNAYGHGGAEEAVRTLNSIFNLDITEYATVNFFGMAKIIDAVGGIDVELTEREVTARGNNNHGINDMIDEVCQLMGYKAKDYYVTQSGKQHLNGIQAVAYSRIRYVANIWGTNNDYGRTDRQRYVMEQLFNKALTMSKSEYPGLIKALIPYTVTSLSPDEILSFAYTIMTKSPTFHQARMPQDDYLMTAPSGSFGSVVYYDLDFAAELIHAFIYDNITFDEYTAANGISKNNWYGNRYSGSSGNSGSTSTRPSTTDDDDDNESSYISDSSDNSSLDDEYISSENDTSIGNESMGENSSSENSTSSDNSSSGNSSSGTSSDSESSDNSGNSSDNSSSSPVGGSSDNSSGGTSSDNANLDAA